MVAEKQAGSSNHFGETLRAARKAAGARLVDLASHLGVSLPYLSDVERGRRDPLSNERIQAVAQYLGADAIALLEAAARDRGKIVIPIGAGDSHLRVKAAALLASNWLRAPRELLDRIVQAFAKEK